MKQLIIFFIVIVFTTVTISESYSQENKFTPEYSVILPSDKGNKTLKQLSRSAPQKIDSYFDLTNSDIQLLESNFKKILKLKSDQCCLVGGRIKTLDNFAFQYVGVVINDKKYIYINAFEYESPEDFNFFYKSWKTEPIIVFDGGESHWGALFDLESKKFSQLAFNGVA